MMTISVKKFRGALPLFLLLVLASVPMNRWLGSAETVHAAQDTSTRSAVLKVEGAVPTPLTLTAEDLAKLPRATATLASDGSTDTYEGVLLYDILVTAGLQFGRMPAGKGTPVCILATATDGFHAVFALGEIDPQLAGEKILIADKENGLPLPDRYKPFRIIAPQDQKHARSIYSLVKLQVVNIPQ